MKSKLLVNGNNLSLVKDFSVTRDNILTVSAQPML